MGYLLRQDDMQSLSNKVNICLLYINLGECGTPLPYA